MPTNNERAKCAAKTKYPSDMAAQQSIKRIKQLHGTGKSLRIYRCNVCGGFHITSAPRR